MKYNRKPEGDDKFAETQTEDETAHPIDWNSFSFQYLLVRWLAHTGQTEANR